MAFSSRRGRPPRPKTDAPDLGTPELCYKRALGLTQEPIDRLLEQGLIDGNHHWCGLHLRWLYTLRYGAPVVTTRYADRRDISVPNDTQTAWQSMREREYADAAAMLKKANHYEPIMRLCVFNEVPAFLSDSLRKRAWHEPALAHQLSHQHRLLLEGLTLLVTAWRPKSLHSK
jgi:hypothetical protein